MAARIARHRRWSTGAEPADARGAASTRVSVLRQGSLSVALTSLCFTQPAAAEAFHAEALEQNAEEALAQQMDRIRARFYAELCEPLRRSRRRLLASRLKYGRLEVAFQRHRDGSTEPSQARPHTALPRGGPSAVLALQRALGNRGTARVLAPKGVSGRGTFENSVRIGKLGPIEITESNIADWIGKKADVDDFVATTSTGKHSDELKRMSGSKARIDNIEVQSISGQNSWVIVTFHNALVRGYAADAAGKTERWEATRFDAVDIKRTSIGKPRP